MRRKIQCGNVCGPNSSGGESVGLCLADSHIPPLERKEGGGRENKKEGAEEMRMIYVLLCRCRNKSSDLAQRGRQAIKQGINSELVPLF